MSHSNPDNHIPSLTFDFPALASVIASNINLDNSSKLKTIINTSVKAIEIDIFPSNSVIIFPSNSIPVDFIVK